MNKNELIQMVADDAGVSKLQASKAVKSLVKAIQGAVQDGSKITLTGLGTFRSKPRKGRMGRNPKTGTQVPVPAGRKVSFKPSGVLRRFLNPAKVS